MYEQLRKLLAKYMLLRGQRVRTFNLSVRIHRSRGTSVIPIHFWSALVYSEEKN